MPAVAQNHRSAESISRANRTTSTTLAPYPISASGNRGPPRPVPPVREHAYAPRLIASVSCHSQAICADNLSARSAMNAYLQKGARDRHIWRALLRSARTLPDLVEGESGLRLGEVEDAAGNFGQS